MYSGIFSSEFLEGYGVKTGGSTKRWCVAFLLVIGDKLKQNNSSVKEKIS